MGPDPSSTVAHGRATGGGRMCAAVTTRRRRWGRRRIRATHHPAATVRDPRTCHDDPAGICDIVYRPPGVRIVGATVTIPGIRIDPNQPIITTPNVVVKIPQLGCRCRR